jgi:hypothetical protein
MQGVRPDTRYTRRASLVITGALVWAPAVSTDCLSLGLPLYGTLQLWVQRSNTDSATVFCLDYTVLQHRQGQTDGQLAECRDELLTASYVAK